MRRFASVFTVSSKRGDQHDAHNDSPPRLAQKKSRIFHSLSRKHLSTHLPPTSPATLIAAELVNSSSSSSSGSITLRTPDDDGPPRTPSKKGSWRSWLGGRNAPVGDHAEERRSPRKSSQSALRPPKPAPSSADDASEHSDDHYGSPDDPYNPPQATHRLSTARANARAMVMNSLFHDPACPPLLQSPELVPYPRSCCKFQPLRRRETLESELHKKSLLARLDRLSPAVELSIAPLALKPIVPKPRIPHNSQDDVFPLPNSVSLRSNTLANWVSRPCFEDRLLLWTCSDSGEITPTRVPGSQLGVAALEFSESLELLAGTLLDCGEDTGTDIAFDPALEFSLPPLTLNLDSPATQSKEPEPEPLSRPTEPSQLNDSPAELCPSPQLNVPLRAEFEEPSLAQQPCAPPTSRSATTNEPVPKRGVRFADDNGKDDQIPLGYVLRIRKNKEQKARFLREERARRERAAQLSTQSRSPPDHRTPRAIPARPRPLVSLQEPPKPRQRTTVLQVVREEERLRREAEKIEMEKLRRSREHAKQQAEERERAYIEELQATRARREASRAGRPLESASLSPRLADRARSGSRDSMHASPRTSMLSHHKHTPELVFSPVSPHEGSPSSSVPATPGSQYSVSRPPSVYSTHTASSEDVRGRDGRRVSRRMSGVSDPTKGMSLYPPYDPRIPFNPYMWTNIPAAPAIPPVPPMPAIPRVNGVPFYGVDMPLLPPTAPFMVNQFGARSRSHTGSTGHQSPMQSSISLTRNNSSEEANSSSRTSSPHSSGSHQRHSSDDAWMRGDFRSASYNDVRGGATTMPMRVASSQSHPHRSSWLPPEQNPTAKSSLRPMSTAYPSGPSAHARRRTTAS